MIRDFNIYDERGDDICSSSNIRSTLYVSKGMRSTLCGEMKDMALVVEDTRRLIDWQIGLSHGSRGMIIRAERSVLHTN